MDNSLGKVRESWAICALILVVVVTILSPTTIASSPHPQATVPSAPGDFSFNQPSSVTTQPTALSQSPLSYSFFDGLNYSNMSQMQAAGSELWTPIPLGPDRCEFW